MSPRPIAEIESGAREVLVSESQVACAYLFGSVARGTAGPLSDIDLGVLWVSRQAGGRDARGRLQDRLVLRLGTDRVDLIDLAAAPAPLRYRVVLDGRVLVCADPRARERFEVDAIRHYLDFKPLRDEAFRVARTAILRAS